MTRDPFDSKVDAPDAILQTDVGRRLDAIIRRHGGKPKPIPTPARMVLPPVGRHDCDGQLEIDQDEAAG